MKAIKMLAASFMALVAVMTSMTGISASAASSGSQEVAPGVFLNGDIGVSWYSPAGGVYVYTVTATTWLSGTVSYSDPWYLYTGLDLDYYPSGVLIDQAFAAGAAYQTPVSASVSGSRRNTQASAFASHEVRGAYSGGFYTSLVNFSI